MRAVGIFFLVLLAMVALPVMLYIGTYNGFARKDQTIIEAERKVASCYQKRADLLTNMEGTVSQYASHEKDTQLGVAQARAGTATPKIDVSGATPEQLAEAQKAATSVFSRLMAVAEATPNLKADRNFLRLQKDLKEVENQCNILRNRQIEAVKVYNTSLKTFPSNIIANMHGFTEKQQIKFDDEDSNKKSPRLFQKH